jgi:hypothetical protein
MVATPLDGIPSQFRTRHRFGSHFGRNTNSSLPPTKSAVPDGLIPRRQSSKQSGTLAARSGESAGFEQLFRSLDACYTATLVFRMSLVSLQVSGG